ncbi:hypothetical protein Glove_669g1 [Diversispora epigaea]|uniref:Uncharacterized protein n=1 Tax=Diversispora epigaea TaxID=1348612 RepID=A0A397G7J3_9GLOM|nr:hypothetical protein Glove_669g1 [Diversispora epigaea]
MQSEIDSLRRQIATLQIELALKEQIQKMQTEIDSLKVQINEITMDSAGLYQEYLTWCNNNKKEALNNNILGKKFALIDIERKRAGNGKREWQYILDRSEIMNKIHKLFGNEVE